MSTSDRANQKYTSITQDYPVLTQIEERKLFRVIHKFKKGKQKQEARERFFNCNFRLVLKNAHYYHNNSHVPLEDLVSAGSEGLCMAIDRFRPYKYKTKFSTYAVYWIKLKIFQLLKSFGMAVYVPSHIVEKSNQYRKAMNKKDTGLLDKELMEELNLTEKALRNVKRSCISVLCLDQEIISRHGGGSRTIGSLVPDERMRPADDYLMTKERKEIIRETLNDLDPVSKDILKSRYFKHSKDTLDDVGKKYKISGERVRQIEYQALKLLRRRLTRKNFFTDY